MSIEQEAAELVQQADMMAAARDIINRAVIAGKAVAAYRAALLHENVPARIANELTWQFAQSYQVRLFGLLACGHGVDPESDVT